MAAHSQFSEERAERVVEALRLGASREGAAACASVAPSTLYDWIRRGKAGEAPYAGFWLRIETEQRAWEVGALRRVHEAAEKGTWQAAAWLLERRLPQHYAKRMDESIINREVEKKLKALLAEAQAKLDAADGRVDRADGRVVHERSERS